jgi:hypothetical protein
MRGVQRGSEESVTIESWQTIVARWGDPIYNLALLTTGAHDAAQTAAVTALHSAVTTPIPDLETSLYRSLAQPQRRWRWPTRSILPRSLRRITPDDRLLLALWLLRGVDGQRLRAIFNTAADEIVMRIQTLLGHEIEPEDEPLDDGHLTLRAWLTHQLGFNAEPSPHVRTCARCQRQQARWHNAVARLRETLRDVVRGQHLPPTATAALEDRLALHDDADNTWWHQRRVWLPALVGVIGLLLLLVIAPGMGSGQTAAAPLSTQELVQATLDAWATPPSDQTIHHQVWARDPYLHGGEAVITDLWLSPDNGAHRVEVRRNDALVEWQVATANGRLSYGAEPSDTSCRWNTGWSGNFPLFERAALRFEITPDQISAVRDARLQQGAYGVGYVALQEAMHADDLRSFGTRIENERALTVLGFTDRRTPTPRQILLRIDPQERQLIGVQEIVQAANQAQTRDLWRLDRSEQVESLPTNQPPWGRVQDQELIDPACPGLKPDQVLSLRALTNSAGRWYVAGSLPPGMSGAAFVRSRDAIANNVPAVFGGGNVLYVGPGRFLSLSASDWRGDRASRDAVEVGAWQVEFRAETGRTNGVIRPQTGAATQPLPSIEFWAGGLSRDELLAIVATLVPLDASTWAEVNDQFLDPQPLPAATRNVMQRTIEVLTAPRNGAVRSVVETTVRTGRVPAEPSDPYHLPAPLRQPATLIQTQTVRYENGRDAQFRAERALPDGSIYDIWQDNGEEFAWYNTPMGTMYTGPSSFLPAHFRPPPPQLDLLSNLLARPEAITLSETDGRWLLIQTMPDTSMSFDQASGRPELPQVPLTSDLPPGDYVQRLWIDQPTSLPQKLDLIHRDRQGREVLLRSIAAITYTTLPSPPAELSALPTPAPDMLQWRLGNEGETILVSAFRALDRTLGWRTADEIVAANGQEQAVLPPSTPTGGLDLPPSSWTQIEVGRYGETTLYDVGTGGRIRVTHGPADLMRHLLRYQVHTNESFGNVAWQRSEPVRVTIDGELREGWLLQTRQQGALVVEIDNTLLHLSGPYEFLNGPFLDRLAELQWIDRGTIDE